MQKSISKATIAWRFILSGFIIISLISCEEANSVGGQFIEGSNLRFDTLYVENFTPQNEQIFSGNLRYSPIGQYNDPLFGNTRSIAFIKPEIDAIADTVDGTYQLKLGLVFNTDLATGDTTKQVNFDIFPIDEFWRGNNTLVNSNIGIDSSRSFGAFTYSREETLTVDLSQDLLLELATYINDDSTNVDSLYNFDFDGLAIVPRNGDSKVIYPDLFASRFFLISPDQDTTSFFSKSHTFTTERTNANLYPNRLYLNSYFENFYSMTFENVIMDYERVNLLKAEFVVIEDKSQLESTLPNSHTRPEVSFLELKTSSPADLRYDLQFTQSEFFGVRDTVINGFRFDMTSHINQYLFSDVSDKTLYFNINPNAGIMRSTLLYDQTSNDSLKPKLILTFSE